MRILQRTYPFDISGRRVKLIAGLLFRDAGRYSAAKAGLVKLFGKADFESGPLVFDHTSYYDAEMGPGLKRGFLGFERLVGLEDIHDVKSRTNRLEAHYTEGGRRTVNIDPGYLDMSKVVLFSTKDYTHRIYLGKGIFAEVTLFFKDNEFNPWPWTYPDYRTKEYRDIFKSIRKLYRESLKLGARDRS